MKRKKREEFEVFQITEIDGDFVHDKKLVSWTVSIALLVIVAIGVLIAWKTIGRDHSAQYETQEARLGTLTVSVTATGTLQPTNEVEVGSELSGIIKSVEVDYNDRVKIGQVLARLDTSKLEAQVKQSRATMESAKGKVFQTQATVRETRSKLAQFQKVRELSHNKVPSQTEMDAAEAALDRALANDASTRADVSQAQATLAAYEIDLSKTVIRSPINGIVLERSVEPGQTVAATLEAPTLFTLAEDLTQMELHVNVDEADIGKVKTGQEATFTVDAYPDRTFQARITEVRYASTTTSGVVTYETVLDVHNADVSLRPGMTATADITVKKIDNVLLVPTAALRFTPPAKLQGQKEAENNVSGGLVSSLMPHPPRSAAKGDTNTNTNKKHQEVWVLKEDRLFAVSVTVGSTNGSMTEVLGGGIRPGMALVVDIAEDKK